MSLAAGTQLGPYEVVDLIGSGAMGEVYRARDTRLRRTVAVKVLPASLTEDPERLRRFEQEARAAGALNHPNIVAVHDMGTESGSPYVVSELLEGSTLRDRMEAGPLGLRKLLDFSSQIARGLAAAHERGIVHRDLKPENVFITRDGAVKILDFGLAKLRRDPAGEPGSDANTMESLTRPGMVLGTVGYMSPEQVRGDQADHRSDIFSFGAILYEMVTGKRAFKGRSAVETMNAILKEAPPEITVTNPDLPPALDRIVVHCLEKDPEERFQSARDLAFDLAALSHLSTLHGRALALPRPRVDRGLAAGLLLALALPLAGYFAGRATSPASVPSFQRLTHRRGLLGSARFAPDGQIVYGAAWDGAERELYSARPESPESRPLGLKRAGVVGITTTGDLGLILARTPQKAVLARASLAGGPPREILEGVQFADVRPDGSAFAIVRSVEGRTRLEYPMGSLLYEASAGLTHARISPDGQKVAFLEHPVLSDDRGFVVVVDREANRTVLTDVFASAEGLAWSPNGKEVWFTAAEVGADSALWAVDLQKRLRLVTRGPGRLVLTDISREGRVLLSRVGMRMEVKAHGPDGERDLSWLDFSAPVGVSRDGKRVLFYESGEGGGRAYGVYLRGLDGSAPVRLGEGRAQAISPDERWVLTIPLEGAARLVLLPAGAGEARTLQDAAIERYDSAWFFPDGKRLLVFATEPGQRPRLYEKDLETGVLRPLLPDGISPAGGYPIAPDGSSILGFAPESETVLLYPLDGSDPQGIPGLGSDEFPMRFTPDGRELYVRVRTGGRGPVKVFRQELATGKRTPWAEIEAADPAGVEGIRGILPVGDGQSYVYSFRRSLSELYLVEGLR